MQACQDMLQFCADASCLHAAAPQPMHHAHTAHAAVVKTVGDGKQAAKEAVERQLARLMQYGALSLSTVEPLLKSLAVEPGKEGAEDKAITRLLFYLVQLALGDGFAGTPLFVPPGRGGCSG